jgi:hypothetical protein
MKKLVLGNSIERKYYRVVNIHNLIIATNNEYDLLLKQIDFEKWIWIDTMSSASLGDGEYIKYSSPEKAIENMLKRNFNVFEIDDWGEFNLRF